MLVREETISDPGLGTNFGAVTARRDARRLASPHAGGMTGQHEESSTGRPETEPDETHDDVPNPVDGVGIGADAGSSFEPEEDAHPPADPE